MSTVGPGLRSTPQSEAEVMNLVMNAAGYRTEMNLVMKTNTALTHLDLYCAWPRACSERGRRLSCLSPSLHRNVWHAKQRACETAARAWEDRPEPPPLGVGPPLSNPFGGPRTLHTDGFQ